MFYSSPPGFKIRRTISAFSFYFRVFVKIYYHIICLTRPSRILLLHRVRHSSYSPICKPQPSRTVLGSFKDPCTVIFNNLAGCRSTEDQVSFTARKFSTVCEQASIIKAGGSELIRARQWLTMRLIWLGSRPSHVVNLHMISAGGGFVMLIKFSLARSRVRSI